jgi:hypothetical protein
MKTSGASVNWLMDVVRQKEVAFIDNGLLCYIYNFLLVIMKIKGMEMKEIEYRRCTLSLRRYFWFPLRQRLDLNLPQYG